MFTASAMAAAAALFAYQTPAEAQSGATEPDPGTPVSTDPVVGEPVDLIEQGLATESGKIEVPSAGGSGGSDATGDWSATDLSHAGSWSQGGSTGGFNYTYGFQLPPGEGPVPQVGLSYSSQAVDGHTVSSNNQSGLIGDGWSYTPGYVERTYASCAAEDGGNTPDATADRCWDGESPSVTLVLDGVNAPLVLDDDTGEWTAASDPNWKVEQLGSPADGSSASTERWRITAADGTVYTFADRAGSTDSRLQVPVFGNHSGEPCHTADDFAASECSQAYRWMLDSVTDVHGNRTEFDWSAETGHYGAAADEENRSAFDRSVRLDRIDYGLRTDDASVQAGQVDFSYTDRCEADCYDADGDPQADNWPETPWDQDCDASPCTDSLSPAFFSSKRLASVATYVPDGSGGFSKVDSWELVQEFLDYGDGEDTVLWLKSVQHTGHVGGTESTPPVTFTGIAFPNRVEHSEGTPSMWRTRLTAIVSETGSVTGVWYSAPDCAWDDLPGPLENDRRCYPVLSEDGESEEWFHKYVVTQVAEFDTTAGQVPVRTYYDYSISGGGTERLWAWNDAEHTADANRTFNQWRGYAQVTTRTGTPNSGTQLKERTRYYRGMDGQPANADGSGSIDVVVADDEGDTATDHEALPGAVFEAASYDGAHLISSIVSRYWTSLAAERSHDGGSLKAWHVGESRSDGRKLLDEATGTWQRTRRLTEFDDRGREIEVSDLGDLSVDDDERCTRTWYADNPAENLYRFPRRSQTVATACDQTASLPTDLVDESRYFYDGSTDDTAAPTRGLATRTEVVDRYENGSPVWVAKVKATYDALGRVLSASDALDRTTTTAYTPAAGGPVESVTTENPLGHTATVHADRHRGQPVKTVDANGGVTEIAYDPLGRTTAAWGPGWDRTEHPEVPTAAYEYKVSNTEPSAVTTYAVTPSGTQRLDNVALYDSLLREAQKQVPTPVGGRLVTGVEYDSRGLRLWESGPNWEAETGPGTDLVAVSQGEDQARTFYSYDGAGRVVLEEFMSHQEILHATETVYGGSTEGWMVATNPPEGATPTATITNARGEMVEKRDYHGDTATGVHDATVYDYTKRGNLETVTDPAGNEWSYSYDLRGRQVSATDPDTGTTTAAYDEAGQLVQTTDARGQTLTTVYDDLGRKTDLYAGDEATGEWIGAWRYDNANNGVGLPYLSVSIVDGQNIITQVRNYDDAGRPTSVTQWLPELPGFEDLAGSYNVQQFYLPDGSVSNTNLPQISGLGKETVAYHYNDLGQATRVFGDFSDGTDTTDYVSEASYTAWGELAQRVLGGTTGEQVHQTWTFQDGTRRVDEHRLSRDSVSSSMVAHLSYEYDQAGNILSIADSVTDSPGEPERQCFVYDYLQRLTDAWAQAGTGECADESDLDASDIGGPGAYWTEYAYDVTGNRTTVTEHGTDGTAETAAYDYTDTEAHLVDTVTTGTAVDDYAWDESGNLTERTVDGQTETLEWDPRGKLASITSDEGTTGMVYDGEGNRIGRLDPDGTQNLFVAGHEISVDPQGVVHATRTYSHNGEMIATRSTDEGLTWIGTTHQGTAAWAVSAATMVLTYRRQDPFGKTRGETVDWTATQQGFHTGTEDPTGLVSMGARFYDPTVGRFISRDPIQRFTDSQQINGYAYTGNNPIIRTDPTGLDWSCIDGDCSYHNNDGSLKTKDECKKTGCGTDQCRRNSCSSSKDTNGGCNGPYTSWECGPQPPSCNGPYTQAECGAGEGNPNPPGVPTGDEILSQDFEDELLSAVSLLWEDMRELDIPDVLVNLATQVIEDSLPKLWEAYGAGSIGLCSTWTLQVALSVSYDRCKIFTREDGWVTTERWSGGLGPSAGAEKVGAIMISSSSSESELVGNDYFAEVSLGQGLVGGLESSVSFGGEWTLTGYFGVGATGCPVGSSCRISAGVGETNAID
ncbi:RHS repeat domain-containing protein [Glycomyces xiaoerkulensis]|uniref:RHS repeat domain-containing protein n=1 Tax=Glycomyces xiaoerkulensis TaxID=2038139 RepID=UPI000C2652C7|nr:RHS repeat-associated core domain-containing protein [Glycomyces xiaoerkulensis]